LYRAVENVSVTSPIKFCLAELEFSNFKSFTVKNNSTLELRFVIRDFAFCLYASNESSFYIMHVYSDLQLEGFSGRYLYNSLKNRVTIFVR